MCFSYMLLDGIFIAEELVEAFKKLFLVLSEG